MHNNFDIRLGNNIQNNKKRYRISNQSILLIVTIVCVFLFVFLIMKSLQIKKTNTQNMELLQNNSENIIVKEVENKIKVDNLNVNFYDLMDNNENIDKIIINNEDSINNSDLDSKIGELFDIKLSSNYTKNNNSNISSNSNNTLDDIINNSIINNSITTNSDNQQNSNNIKEKEIINLELIKNNEIDSTPKQLVVKTYKKGIKVQLGAMKTNEFAIEYRDNIIAMYGDLFKDLECFIEDIDLKEKGIFYRLRFGIFETKKSAESFCNKYIKLSNGKLSSCIVINE